ncbi:hypothetical protein RchiOBHm_Chr5g0037591 [Rosa chinensis]|uniref:Uncharacterized protein n=1 Tax=Rosa chinensis TaxID=74649 RepID=A0A2P6QBT4_ROSCH|nr:hypothetical protein RchiOBHm_Chr5g0037591 [Rosa chinensis]
MQCSTSPATKKSTLLTPLSRRHESSGGSFLDSLNSDDSTAVKSDAAVNFLDDRYLSDADGDRETTEVSKEEAEAASWLLPDPTDLNLGQYMFSDMDPYLDLDYGAVDLKAPAQEEQNSSGTDEVVPVQSKTVQPQSFEMELPTAKPFIYGYHGQCIIILYGC